MAVYPSNVAPIGTKLWENAFQKIPHVSFFDAKKNRSDILWPQKIDFFSKNRFFWRKSGEFLSVNSRFLVENHCLSFLYFLVTTLGGGVNESERVFEADIETKKT